MDFKIEKWNRFIEQRKRLIVDHCMVDNDGEAIDDGTGMLTFRSTKDKDYFLSGHRDIVGEYLSVL